MANTRGVLERWVAVLMLGALGACGGGGGGGGGGGPTGTLSLSTNTLTFGATGTAATPPGQGVTATVTGVSGGTLFIRIVSTGPAVGSVSGVTITSPTTGQATVFPASAAALGAGSFTSTITVTACTTNINCSGALIGTPQTINVTYTIPGVASSPSSLTYSIGNTAVPAHLSRNLTVTGFPAQSWSAAANVPWLSILPASGSTGSAVQLTGSLPQNELDALSNGTRSASITITPSSGTPLVIPVTLTVSRTQVSYIAPYVGISGVAAKAIVRGNKFSEATITGVKFGAGTVVACPGLDCTLASDTEIDVTYPALLAGTYPVQIENVQGFNRSFANLVIVDAPSFTQTTLPYTSSASTPLSVKSFAYDAERKALVVGVDNGLPDDPSLGNTNAGFIRFSYTTVWESPTTGRTLGVIDAALTVDGKQWIALDSLSGVTRVDATTLVAGTREDPASVLGFGEGLRKLVVTNDGKAVLTSSSSFGASLVYLYDTPSTALASISPFSVARDAGQFTQNLFDANPGVSGNGALAALLQSRVNPTQPVFQYSASTGTLAATGASQNGTFSVGVGPGPVLDRNGLRTALIEGDAVNQSTVTGVHVYDQDFAPLGALPNTTAAVVLKPDPLGAATRAYTLDIFSTCSIRAFDLTTVVTGSFAEIISVSYPITVTCPTGGAKMAITPDGGTVFVADGLGVRVVPAP